MAETPTIHPIPACYPKHLGLPVRCSQVTRNNQGAVTGIDAGHDQIEA